MSSHSHKSKVSSQLDIQPLLAKDSIEEENQQFPSTESTLPKSESQTSLDSLATENAEDKSSKSKKKKKKKKSKSSLQEDHKTDKTLLNEKEKKLLVNKENNRTKVEKNSTKYPEYGIMFVIEAIGTLIKYGWDVFIITLNILKPFLALYLVLVFVVWNINIGTSSVYNLVDHVHSAACKYPFMGHILDCQNVAYQNKIPNFSQLVEKQGIVYSEILTQLTKSDVPLPLELKKAELAVTDLKTTVRYSRLDSTELLVEHLNDFQGTAKQVGRQIQYLQAKATTGLDKFVIHNSYLLKYLDRIDGNPYRSWMDYFVPSFLGPSRDEIQGMYRTSMETARSDVRDLILLAQETLGGLDQLDSILNGVYEISTREKNLQIIQKDELLAELWSILGGNKVQRKFFEENLSLLQQLDSQRHLALSQVQAILMKLSELQADLEVLKEQVTHPLIQDIPLRVHIQTIENLLTRVRNQQLIPTAASSSNQKSLPSVDRLDPKAIAQ
ncbi:hypothetical protein K7432_011036 [Basidiobolus ranarum]|uniref:Uncharacterized protein n=1 Tax=Basidiobolus ranarum TaxID=34480 RepID=A0ABR2WMT8_9FUNG